MSAYKLKQVSQLFCSLPCSVLMPQQPPALGVIWWDDVALILLLTPLSLWLVLLWGFLWLALAGGTTRGNICTGCYQYRRGMVMQCVGLSAPHWTLVCHGSAAACHSGMPPFTLALLTRRLKSGLLCRFIYHVSSVFLTLRSAQSHQPSG